MPRTRRKRRCLRWMIGVVAVVVLPAVLIVVLRIPLPMGWLVPFVQDKASAAVGGPVQIRGALRLTPGLVSTVTCTDLALGAGDLDDGHTRAGVEMVTVAIDVLPLLLHGQLHINDFEATGIRIQLPASDMEDDRQSDVGGTTAAPVAVSLAGPSIAVERFFIRDLAIVGVNAASTGDPVFSVQELTGSLPAGGELALAGTVCIGTTPITLECAGGSLASLYSETTAWPVHVEARASNDTVSLTGHLERTNDGHRFRGAISLEMGTLELAQTHVPMDLRELVPLSLEANLIAGAGALQLTNLRGRARDMDLALSLDADWDKDGLGLDLTGEVGPVDVQAIAESINAGWNIPVRIRHGRIQLASRGASLRDHLRSLNTSVSVDECAWNPVEGPAAVEIRSGTVRVRPGQATEVAIEGTLIGIEVAANASVVHPAELFASRATPIDVHLSRDGATVALNGIVRGIGERLDADLHLTWLAENINDISAWSGITSDAPLPFHAAADLALRGEGGALNLDQISLGHSDLSGVFTWSNRADRTHLSTRVTSERVNLRELVRMKATKTGVGSDRGQRDVDPDFSLLASLSRLPAMDFAATIGGLTGGRLHLEDVRLEGTSDGSSQLRAAIQFNLHDAPFAGDLVADWDGDTPTVQVTAAATDVEAGSVLEDLGIVEDMDLTLASLQLEATSSGNHLQDLLDESEITLGVSNVQLLIPHPARNRTLAIDLERVTLNAPRHAFVIDAAGTFEGRPIELTLECDEAHLRQEDPVLPVRLGVRSNGHELRVESRLSLPLRKPPWEFRFALRGQDLSGLAYPEEPRLPDVGPYDFSGRLLVYEGGLAVKEAVLAVASSRLEGNLTLERRDGRPFVGLELAAQTLQLAEFKKDRGETTPVSKSADGQQATPGEAMPGPVESVLRTIVRDYDGAIHLEAAEVLSGEDRLGAGVLEAGFRDGTLDVSRCTLDLEASMVDVGLRYGLLEDDADVALTVHVVDFDYGIAARRLSRKSTSSGRLGVDVDLAARTPSLRGLLPRADGSIRFSIWPANLEAKIFDLWASNLLLNLLPTLKLGGDSVVNCIAGDFEVQDGIMHIRDVLIDSTQVQVKGKGSIDFARERIHVGLKPRPKRPRFLSLATPIAIEGPLAHPRVSVSAGGVTKTLIRLYYSAIVFPWEWLTQQRIPRDNSCECHRVAGTTEVGDEDAAP